MDGYPVMPGLSCDPDAELMDEATALAAEAGLAAEPARPSEPPGAPVTLLAPPTAPLIPVVVLSLLAHGLVAVALGALGAVPVLSIHTDSFVEIEMAALPAPEPEVVSPEPEPVIAPETPPPAAIQPRLRPVREVEPTPEPEPTATPPSVDDVFGEEPAPSAEIMTAEGPGAGVAMDPGTPGGVAGGRPGGTGEGLGRVGTAPVATGPTDADRRRARRAYVRSLEGMLNGHIRYPRAAARDRLEGRAEICFRIGEDGRVLGTRVCSSTGHGILDEAAGEAARALSRVPAPPALAAWAPSDEIHAGVVFVIR